MLFIRSAAPAAAAAAALVIPVWNYYYFVIQKSGPPSFPQNKPPSPAPRPPFYRLKVGSAHCLGVSVFRRGFRNSRARLRVACYCLQGWWWLLRVISTERYYVHLQVAQVQFSGFENTISCNPRAEAQLRIRRFQCETTNTRYVLV